MLINIQLSRHLQSIFDPLSHVHQQNTCLDQQQQQQQQQKELNGVLSSRLSTSTCWQGEFFPRHKHFRHILGIVCRCFGCIFCSILHCVHICLASVSPRARTSRCRIVYLSVDSLNQVQYIWAETSLHGRCTQSSELAKYFVSSAF